METKLTDRHSGLVALLKDRSLRFGSFTLASGRRSTFYIDARATTMSSEGLELIGTLGLEAIRAHGWKAELVGGLTMGADPVAFAIAMASRESPPQVDAFSVRKEAKKYGEARAIEGCFHRGASVVIVEDVITSGGSALTAARAVAEAGGLISGILAVVDRQEGGRRAIEEAGYPVRTLLTAQDLGVQS